MKKVFTLAIVAIALSASAQNTETTSKKLNVFSTVGVSFANKSYKPASGNSVQTTTGLELRLSRPSSLGIALSYDSYGYKKSASGYNLDGSLRATALGLFYRHLFGTGTWQPYLRAGGGTAWLSLPTVDVKGGTTTIGKEVQNVGVALAEVGIQARVHSRYSLLLGAEKRWMGKSSLADHTSIRTVGFKVGITSAF